jgi:hypothetical protein
MLSSQSTLKRFRVDQSMSSREPIIRIRKNGGQCCFDDASNLHSGSRSFARSSNRSSSLSVNSAVAVQNYCDCSAYNNTLTFPLPLAYKSPQPPSRVPDRSSTYVQPSE